MALTDNLVAYYKFDDNAANTTVDDAHTTNVDATSASNTSTISSATAKIGTSFDFTGNDESTGPDWIDLNDGLFTDADSTISFWIKTPSAFGTINQYPFYIHTPFKMAVWVSSTGVLTGTMGSDTSNTGSTLSTNTWYHIIMTRDQSAETGIIYLNNSSDITFSSTGTGNCSAISLGGWNQGGGNFWTGYIDEVGIWSRIITSDERAELYNSGNGLTYPFGPTIFTVSKSESIDISDVFTRGKITISKSFADSLGLTDTFSRNPLFFVISETDTLTFTDSPLLDSNLQTDKLRVTIEIV